MLGQALRLASLLAHRHCASVSNTRALDIAFETLCYCAVLALHHARQPLAGPSTALLGPRAALNAAGDARGLNRP